MRVVIQRVRQASVAVDGQISGKIGPGLLVLAGFEPNLIWEVASALRT